MTAHQLRIGFTPLRGDIGPKIFMRRLRDSIYRQGLARVGSFLDPRCDALLFYSILRGCIYQSAYAQRMCDSILAVVSKDSVIINNAVSLEEFCPQGPSRREALSIPNDAVVLAASTKWRVTKRLGEYLRVLEALRRDGDDFRLLLIGDINTDVANQPGVISAGRVTPANLPQWYRAGDICLNLAFGDPCDNSVVEAAACGLPCVTTWIGGSAEVIQRASAGIASRCEPPFPYGEFKDMRQVPRVDVQTVAADVRIVASDLDAYRTRISCSRLDIDLAAQRYVEFIDRIPRERRE